MPTINDLPQEEQDHWNLHLNALKADNPGYTQLINAINLLQSGSIAFTQALLDKTENGQYPAYLHDYFEIEWEPIG